MKKLQKWRLPFEVFLVRNFLCDRWCFEWKYCWKVAKFHVEFTKLVWSRTTQACFRNVYPILMRKLQKWPTFRRIIWTWHLCLKEIQSGKLKSCWVNAFWESEKEMLEPNKNDRQCLSTNTAQSCFSTPHLTHILHILFLNLTVCKATTSHKAVMNYNFHFLPFPWSFLTLNL